MEVAPSLEPLQIDERLKFPGLVLDYQLGLLQPETCKVYAMELRDLQYTYPHPPPPESRGDAACAWFATMGQWRYVQVIFPRTFFASG